MVTPRHTWTGLVLAATVSIATLSPNIAFGVKTRSQPTDVAQLQRDRPELYQDQPPPTLWDRRGEDANIRALAPEKVGDNQSFLMQLVRTIVALCGVLFLLWAFARVIGPRLGRALGGKRANNMQVSDRLNLDGRNTLIRVTMADGSSYLIACGDHAIKLIDKLPAPAGPTSSAAAAPAVSFAQRMGATEVPEE